MREKHLRKLQKDRHLAEIAFNLLSNPTFKNLSRRERGQLAKLIYKAELIEVELRSKDTTRVMNAFKDIINGINIQILEAADADDENFDENDDFPPRY